MSTFITVAIPYVNATPHLGYAYELIEAIDPDWNGAIPLGLTESAKAL